MAKQSSAPPTPPPRLCPTCGTRVGELATKCIVCGAELGGPAATTKPQRQWRSLLPERPKLAPAGKPSPAVTQQTGAAPPASSGVNGVAAPPASPAAAPAPRGGVNLPLPI
ncbi:MAG TPA: hypothetical protein VI547_01300, partial [Anaerolineales bacterium]|nr:hypothetical protein [Anaerolineales bacterium]